MPRAKALLLIVAVLPLGCRGKAIPVGPVNVEYAGIYGAVSRQHLVGSQPAPDKAIAALESLRKKEGDNAMTAYLLAAAFAKKQDWSRVATEIKTGNRAPACVYYVDDGLSVYWNIAGFAVLRTLVRECAAVAPSLGEETGIGLLQDARLMAKRVASVEPPMVVGLLVGIALTAIVDKGIEDTYVKAGRVAEARQASQRRLAFREWSTGVKEKIKATVKTEEMIDIMNRAGILQEEAEALEKDPHPRTEALRKKIEVANRDILAAERAHIKKAIETWPAD
jgi:hypothetical protein